MRIKPRKGLLRFKEWLPLKRYRIILTHWLIRSVLDSALTSIGAKMTTIVTFKWFRWTCGNQSDRFEKVRWTKQTISQRINQHFGDNQA